MAESDKAKGQYHTFLWVAAGVVIAAIVICGVVGRVANPPSSSPARAVEREPSTYRVEYQVYGTADAVSVTYSNAQGGTEQGDYRVPFLKAFTMEPGDFAYISAQNLGESGTVICRIKVNGEEWRESTSSGAYVIASCDGAVGRD